MKSISELGFVICRKCENRFECPFVAIDKRPWNDVCKLIADVGQSETLDLWIHCSEENVEEIRAWTMCMFMENTDFLDVVSNKCACLMIERCSRSGTMRFHPFFTGSMIECCAEYIGRI